jgi:hypothetical protein
MMPELVSLYYRSGRRPQITAKLSRANVAQILFAEGLLQYAVRANLNLFQIWRLPSAQQMIHSR